MLWPVDGTGRRKIHFFVKASLICFKLCVLNRTQSRLTALAAGRLSRLRACPGQRTRCALFCTILFCLEMSFRALTRSSLFAFHFAIRK